MELPGHAVLVRKVESARIRAGGALSRADQLAGWPWLVYNPWIFLHFDRAGQLPAQVLSQVVGRFLTPGSVVDLGCGTGVYLAALRSEHWLPANAVWYSREGAG